MITHSAGHFWDEVWGGFRPFELDPAAFLERARPGDRALLTRIGEVEGRWVLDLGCGNGELAVYFAKRGARVVAIDSSPMAVRNAQALAMANGVGAQVDAQVFDALDLGRLGMSFDRVIGKFILHHIEPFEVFAQVLFDVLAAHGRAVFLENNARNPVLMLARRHLVGKFGIPKYGDEHEYPLEPREIDILRGRFAHVSVQYPEFLCFGLASAYLFKKHPLAERTFRALDRCVDRLCPPLRPYGYRQLIELAKR
jgi:SAM-dependent methyltransferase